MRYVATSDLPPAVRRLRPHAQEIFLSVFNNAWQSYADRGPHEQEESAFRVAWAAVKKHYRTQGELGFREAGDIGHHQRS